MKKIYAIKKLIVNNGTKFLSQKYTKSIEAIAKMNLIAIPLSIALKKLDCFFEFNFVETIKYAAKLKSEATKMDNITKSTLLVEAKRKPTELKASAPSVIKLYFLTKSMSMSFVWFGFIDEIDHCSYNRK